MTAPQRPVDVIRSALALFAQPGDVIEVRVPKVGGRKSNNASGYFSDLDAAAKAAARYDGKAAGIYVTVNPVDPALLARANERIIEYAELSTSDDAILRRRWLLIDCDPKRPAGISSTAEEHAAAHARARAIRDWLELAGWPAPVYADSGNGAHLLYPVVLPNDDASRELQHACLRAIAARFDDDAVTVDQKVFNAARIWKVYGTMARKGDNTSERPHRRAAIIDRPAELVPVALDLLRTLARSVAEPEPNEAVRAGGIDDAGAWLASHGVSYREKPNVPASGATTYQIDCPFDSDHVGDAYVIKGSRGGLKFGCYHNSCQDRDWRAFRALYEPLPPPRDKPPTTPSARPSAMPDTPEEPVAKATKKDNDDAAYLWAQRFRDRLAYDATSGTWRQWAGTHWQQLLPGDPALDDAGAEVLRAIGLRVSGGAIDDTARLARRRCLMTFTRSMHLVNFANGTLDVASGTLRPHSPADGLTSCLPYAYDPKGVTPTIDALIAELAPDPAAGRVLRTHIGLALLNDATFHKAVLLLGAPGSGKTTLLLLTAAAMGASPDLPKFAPGLIYRNDREGSLQRGYSRDWPMILSDEFPADVLRDEEPFKAMTAHSAIDSRIHHAHPVNERWRPKALLAANDMPQFSDKTGAIKRRLIVITCPTIRDEAAYDRAMLNRSIAELGAFAAQCIAAAHAAIAANTYPISRAMEAAYDELVIDGDPVKAWAAERAVLLVDNAGLPGSSSLRALVSDLAKDYNAWAEANHHKSMSTIGLSKRLVAYAPWRVTRHRTEAGQYLLGIALADAHPDLAVGNVAFEAKQKKLHTDIGHQEALDVANVINVDTCIAETLETLPEGSSEVLEKLSKKDTKATFLQESYSLEGVRQDDGTETWHIYDDTTNAVVHTEATEAAAIAWIERNTNATPPTA